MRDLTPAQKASWTKICNGTAMLAGAKAAATKRANALRSALPTLAGPAIIAAFDGQRWHCAA